MLLLSAADVDRLLRLTVEPRQLVELMGRAFHSLSLSDDQSEPKLEPAPVQSPHRVAVDTPNDTVLFMPCRLALDGGDDGDDDNAHHSHRPRRPTKATTGLKIVSVPKPHSSPSPSPPTTSRDAIEASTILVDEDTGKVDAVLDAAQLTGVRTAAGSVLGTLIALASTPSYPPPTHLVIFGAGTQAYHHARLHLLLFPTIISCVLVNRSDNDRLRGVVRKLEDEFASDAHRDRSPRPPVHFQALAAEWDRSDTTTTTTTTTQTRLFDAVSTASILCTCTPSTSPLFPASWLLPPAPHPGPRRVHLSLAGSYRPSMIEVAPSLVSQALPSRPEEEKNPKFTGAGVFVDSRHAVRLEAGEFVNLPDRAPGWDDVREVGECVDDAGRIRPPPPSLSPSLLPAQGDQADTVLSVFKSVGVAVQDLAIARLIVDLGRRHGIGTEWHA